MRTTYKTLSESEFNVLEKIANYTGMHVWFSIRQDNNGTDYVYDLEEKRKMCLRTGVKQLVEGIPCNDYMLYLYSDEAKILADLLEKLKIKI